MKKLELNQMEQVNGSLSPCEGLSIGAGALIGAIAGPIGIVAGGVAGYAVSSWLCD